MLADFSAQPNEPGRQGVVSLVLVSLGTSGAGSVTGSVVGLSLVVPAGSVTGAMLANAASSSVFVDGCSDTGGVGVDWVCSSGAEISLGMGIVSS